MKSGVSRRSLAIAVGGATLVFLFLALAQALRERLGIELSAESLQTWVAGYGWAAPAVFLAVVSFRPFLLLPSGLLLSVGGLCFGAALGTALGATGIACSSLMQFAIARGGGHDWVQARLGERARGLRHRIERAGPPAIGVLTAHPAGPLTWIAWIAGLSSVPLLGFAVAVLLGGTVRSFTYAVFGTTLADVHSPEFLLGTGLLLLAGVLPLLHPKVFRWLIGGDERPEKRAG